MEKGGVGELCPFLLLLYLAAQVRCTKWSVNLYGKKMDSCADGHSHGAYRISGDHRDGSRQQRGN